MQQAFAFVTFAAAPLSVAVLPISDVHIAICEMRNLILWIEWHKQATRT